MNKLSFQLEDAKCDLIPSNGDGILPYIVMQFSIGDRSATLIVPTRELTELLSEAK